MIYAAMATDGSLPSRRPDAVAAPHEQLRIRSSSVIPCALVRGVRGIGRRHSQERPRLRCWPPSRWHDVQFKAFPTYGFVIACVVVSRTMPSPSLIVSPSGPGGNG